MQSAATAEAAAERKERRRAGGGGGRIPGERRNGIERGEEELHASLVPPPPPISERTDSSRGLTAARWFLSPSLSIFSVTGCIDCDGCSVGTDTCLLPGTLS